MRFIVGHSSLEEVRVLGGYCFRPGPPLQYQILLRTGNLQILQTQLGHYWPRNSRCGYITGESLPVQRRTSVTFALESTDLEHEDIWLLSTHSAQ